MIVHDNCLEFYNIHSVEKVCYKVENFKFDDYWISNIGNTND